MTDAHPDIASPLFPPHAVPWICLVLAALIFIWDSSIELGVAGGVPYILVVLVALWGQSPRLPLYMAGLGSVLTVAGFFSSPAPAEGELWKVLANRALALFAIWAVALLSVQRRMCYEEKQQALQQLKVLQGLLPICASCKKIRDTEGHWSPLESYIHDHSEARFTHSMCPICAQQHYPDL